jgi:hypothetical protein
VRHARRQPALEARDQHSRAHPVTARGQCSRRLGVQRNRDRHVRAD